MPHLKPEELLGFCKKMTNTCGIQQSGLLKLQCWNGKKITRDFYMAITLF